MKVYISGRITDLPFDEAKQAFDKAEQSLKEQGYSVVNPIKNGLDNSASWAEHMREDLKMMLDCDTIYMLRGYELSRGAMIEKNLAESLGFRVLYE